MQAIVRRKVGMRKVIHPLIGPQQPAQWFSILKAAPGGSSLDAQERYGLAGMLGHAAGKSADRCGRRRLPPPRPRRTAHLPPPRRRRSLPDHPHRRPPPPPRWSPDEVPLVRHRMGLSADGVLRVSHTRYATRRLDALRAPSLGCPAFLAGARFTAEPAEGITGRVIRCQRTRIPRMAKSSVGAWRPCAAISSSRRRTVASAEAPGVRARTACTPASPSMTSFERCSVTPSV